MNPDKKWQWVISKVHNFKITVLGHSITKGSLFVNYDRSGVRVNVDLNNPSLNGSTCVPWFEHLTYQALILLVGSYIQLSYHLFKNQLVIKNNTTIVLWWGWQFDYNYYRSRVRVGVNLNIPFNAILASKQYEHRFSLWYIHVLERYMKKISSSIILMELIGPPNKRRYTYRQSAKSPI